MGIMSYVSSPLWLLLLIVSVADMLSFRALPPASYIGLQPSLPFHVSHAAELMILVLATLVLLYGPKLLAVVALLESPEATRAHGGTSAVLMSAVWEAVFATLIAPIVMLQHSWYVFSILMGMATGWNPQTRTDRALPLMLTVRKFGVHTVIGLVVTVLLWRATPESFNWFLPLLAGLWLAIPLVLVSSSPFLGEWIRKDGLFLVPSETRGSKVLGRAHALAKSHQPQPVRAEMILNDARVRDLHLALLAETPLPPVDPLKLWSLRERVRRGDTAAFSRDEWSLLLSDPEGLKALSAP
jgi:membrane glycosyltransferase